MVKRKGDLIIRGGGGGEYTNRVVDLRFLLFKLSILLIKTYSFIYIHIYIYIYIYKALVKFSFMGDLDNTIDAKLFHKQHIWFLYGNVALSSYIRPNSSCIWACQIRCFFFFVFAPTKSYFRKRSTKIYLGGH